MQALLFGRRALIGVLIAVFGVSVVPGATADEDGGDYCVDGFQTIENDYTPTGVYPFYGITNGAGVIVVAGPVMVGVEVRPFDCIGT